MQKVCIVGASGYTGVELLRLLNLHNEVQINQITSRQYTGKALVDVFPHFQKSKYQNLIFSSELTLESDIYFLCLPHEASLDLAKKLIDAGKTVIDLSAAYRIKDETAYPEYYRFSHKYTDLLEKAAYGLPEVYRNQIKNSKLIANPGCYPTATLLGLYPALKEKIITDEFIVVNALSGISGAGRGLKQQFHYPEAFGDAYAYNPLKHRHIPEIEDKIKDISKQDIKIRFTPHILPVSRGMIANITFKTDATAEKLKEIYQSTYKDEPFIRFVEKPPHIKHVAGSNFCDIYIAKDERTGSAVVITAIDNLGKGASSQAVQNMNVVLGIDETKYLKELSEVSILFP